MATMIGVRPMGDRKVAVDEFPIPDTPPGDVLIRIRGAGVCGSDLHVVRRTPDEIADRRPIILGHADPAPFLPSIIGRVG
ncbi:MAG: alcohol dehydrogenase catalytic domain-containing protein [Actinobacteria bacterium]|nr:alcohol dehydrogenase catalytic domain-containing protein [Actinomycetota bacterium]